MKQIPSLIAFLFLPFLIFAQDAAQDSAYLVNNYDKLEEYISMRDGVRLFTSIYLPKDRTADHPIMLSRTPYSCAPYGKDQYNSRLWTRYQSYYIRRGYIMVFQDVRGRWMSEGEYVNVRPFNPNKKGKKDTDEASDTYDTIDWLVKNLPKNNGKLGVMGISYPGFYSTMAALSGHPALKAVSPQAPVTDWFIGDDFHHNGAFFQMDAFSFYSSFGKPRPKPTTVGPTRFSFPTPDNYDFFLEAGPVKNLNAMYLGDSIAFWKDLMAHPNYDAFWQARNPRNFVRDVKPAMLVVGGLFDAEDCFGAWRTYEAIEEKSPAANNKLVMGPWYHGQWSRGDGSYLGHVFFGGNTSIFYQNEIEMPFFRYHLEGKGDISDLAEATIFYTGANQWQKHDQWPPAGQTDRMMYFHADGSMEWTKSSATDSKSTYVSDPDHPVPYTSGVHLRRTREYMLDDQRFAERRADVLTFETDVLTEDLTLAGTPIADLLVSISGTDADFVVKIIDVFPDDFSYDAKMDTRPADRQAYPMGGYQMLVRGEIIRGRFRNSFETPEAFTPNKVERVRFELPDVAHTFKKGHRLMIQIQSSWFPLVDRNPHQFINIYEADAEDFQKATINVHHNQEHASGILLPVWGGR